MKMLEKFVVTWYSRDIFNNLSKDNQIIIRKLEKDLKKLTMIDRNIT